MTPSSSQQDTWHARVVSYGTDDFEQAIASIEDALRGGHGKTFLFLGASKEEKQEAVSKVTTHNDLNLYRFTVPRLVGGRLVETQGNLRESFDTADEAAAVLFFDEADVLFDSSHADDADEEDTTLSDYFFDRMESYPGVCIVCFSAPQYAGRLEGHDVDVVVEF